MSTAFTTLGTLNKNLTWTSSDRTVAYVSSYGVVVGLHEGTATITVSTANGKTDSCEVTVAMIIPLTEISLPESAEISYGEELVAEVTYIPSNTTDDKSVMWSSSDEGIFTVSEEGIITPTGIGTATLTATVGEFTASSEITIVKGTLEYEIPNEISATCGQALGELVLPHGFEWEDPQTDVGSAGQNQHMAKFIPDDTENYNTVDDITVVVNVSHTFTDEWIDSPDSHWHECICGERSDEDGHVFDDWVITTEPTCIQLGEREAVCSDCGYTKHETLNLTGHDWHSDYTVDVEATCTEKGEKSIYCKTCGEKKDASTVEIPALGHVYAEKVIEPTCTQGGFTFFICGRCGDYYEEDETAPKGHTFSDWIVDTDSTCTEEGIRHRECEDCGYIETRGIDKKEHSFDTEYTVDKEPTCTSDGSRSYHCTSEGCTATTGSEVIPAAGHEYSDWTVTREATCTVSGEMQRTCAVCDETEIVEYGARGHVWLKDHTVDQAATCTEDGAESIRCAACDAVKEGSEQVIPATGHQLAHIEAVAPTYEEEGNIEYYSCSACGKLFGDEAGETEITIEDTVLPRLVWIPVAGISLNKVQVTMYRQAKERLEAAIDPSDASEQAVLWTSSDESVATVDEDGIVTAAGFGDAVITATTVDGNISAECEIHVRSRVKIVNQPLNAEIKSGDDASFSVVVEGEDVAYQWQYSIDGDKWNNCKSGGYDTDTLHFVMNKKYAGRRYRCVVTSGEDSEVSEEAVLSLKQSGSITKQPEDASVAVGEQASFHVEATGDNVSYQWQYNISGTYWGNCTGAGYNTDTFGFVMQKKFAGRRYRCLVTIDGETLTSDAALLSLRQAGEIVQHPEDTAVAVGETASFHVGFSGDDPVYQWQYSIDGSYWSNCKGTGYNTDEFSFVMQEKFAGRRYRCVITTGAETFVSDSATVSIAGSSLITVQPEDVQTKVGEQASFFVETTYESPKYQWQWSTDGSDWKNCTGSGFNTDTFSFTAQKRFSGRRYRCVITEGTETEYSRSGLLTVE